MQKYFREEDFNTFMMNRIPKGLGIRKTNTQKAKKKNHELQLQGAHTSSMIDPEDSYSGGFSILGNLLLRCRCKIPNQLWATSFSHILMNVHDTFPFHA